MVESLVSHKDLKLLTGKKVGQYIDILEIIYGSTDEATLTSGNQN